MKSVFILRFLVPTDSVSLSPKNAVGEVYVGRFFFFFLAGGSRDEFALCSCLGPFSHDLAELTGPCY